MSGYLPPMLIMVGLSYADEWQKTSSPTAGIPVLIAGGVATGLLAFVNMIPGASGLATGIAWIALIAVGANSTIVTDVLKTVSGK